MVEELSPVRGADRLHPPVSQCLVYYLDHDSCGYLLTRVKDPGHELEGQELPPADGADGQENVTTTDDAGSSHSHVTAQEHDSERASNKSSNNRTWELVVAMQKESHEGDLMDYREAREALQAQHQQDMAVATGRMLVLQKRVNTLAAAIPSDHRLRSSGSGNLRQTKTRLCSFIATVGSENQELNTTLGNAQRHGDDLEGQLAESLESQRALANHLQKAHHEAEMYFSRMHWLNYELEDQQGDEEQPAKYVDPDLELELRDARYAELRTSSRTNLKALRELMTRAKADKAAASLKIALLKAELEARDDRRACLEESKDTFQRQCEEVFEELIPPSDLSTAMIELFRLAVGDSHALQTKIRDHRRNIFSGKDDVKLLSHEIKTLKRRSLWAKGSQVELEEKIRAHDITIGRLEFKLDCVHEEHAREMKDRGRTLASLTAQHEDLSNELDCLSHPSGDADVQALLQRKSKQLADLVFDARNLRAEISALQKEHQARDQVAGDTAVEACASERESEELKVRLRAATEEIASLRARLGKSGQPVVCGGFQAEDVERTNEEIF